MWGVSPSFHVSMCGSPAKFPAAFPNADPGQFILDGDLPGQLQPCGLIW